MNQQDNLGHYSKERTEQEVLRVIDEGSMYVPHAGCRLWIKCVDKDGYGKVYFQKKHWRVHRLVYALNYKIKLSPKDFIQHKCDTPQCCNINHLDLGNAKTNMQDKVRKGRLRNQNIGKRFCKNGHDISIEGSYYESISAAGNLRRSCRACALLASARRHRKLKVTKTDLNESTQ